MLVQAYQADEDTLRAALTAKSGAERFAAAYVVGERQLPWQADLIDRLTDPHPLVRQAARRSLIVLSFFALLGDGPDDALSADRPAAKPAVVDFGPKPAANQSAQEQAAKKWQDWWDEHGGSGKPSQLRAAGSEAEMDAAAARLGAALVFAPPERQAERLARYRDEKGVVYTEAIADALAQLDGEVRAKAREYLAERLARMKASTLRDRLGDARAELRRAAALAWAMKDDRAAIPELIPLLRDEDEIVVRAAKAGLKSLTGRDFGPARDATPAQRAAAARAWQAWWEKQP
jgi:hypothetical protein